MQHYPKKYFIKEYEIATPYELSVKNFVFTVIGYEGYLKLVKESLDIVNTELESGLNDDDKIQALTELKDSYIKTLEGTQPKRTFTKQEPDKTYVEHCQVLECDIVEQHIIKERKYRNIVTKIKDEYRKKLPLKDYVRAFIIDEKETKLFELN